MLAFLNELSRPTGSVPPQIAKQVIDSLVALLRHIKNVRRDLSLHSAEPISAMSVGDNYPIARWCNDGDCREEWRFLRALENRAPFGKGLEELGKPSLEVEYHFNGTKAQGLGWAHLYNSLAISFDHMNTWHLPQIMLTRTMIHEVTQGAVEIQEDVVEAVHAALEQHVQIHQDWLAQACRRRAQDPAELWRRRAELFPNLEFLPHVEKQICELHTAHPWFDAIAQRLEEIDMALGQWIPHTMPEPAWRSAVTPEGEQRKKLCVFTDLDGEDRCFDLHARFTPGAGRLHFRLDGKQRKAIIAHAGSKIGL